MIQGLLAGYICDETFILNDCHLCLKRQGMVLIAVTNLVLHQVGVQNQIRKTQTRLQLLHGRHFCDIVCINRLMLKSGILCRLVDSKKR